MEGAVVHIVEALWTDGGPPVLGAHAAATLSSSGTIIDRDPAGP